MECIFIEYIKFVDNFLTDYYKEILLSKYDKDIVRPFIEKYIDVRYYNKYSVEGKNFTQILNRELNSVAKELMNNNEKKKELIKDVFALFSYVLFIDGCNHFNDINILLKALFTDENINISYSTDSKKNITNIVKKYISKKIDFFKIFSSDEFYLKGKKYEDHLFNIDLGNRCNISKLYSEYAINKAYNSEVVLENRIYLTLIMLTSKILSEVISLNFSNYYIINFPSSLFEKSKKIMRFLKALDDELLKEKISLKIYYKDYKKYRKYVRQLINEGYNFSLELDESYNTDFEDLFLFSNILVSKKYNYYDIIINSKDVIKTNIITI